MKNHNYLSALSLARAHGGGLRRGTFFDLEPEIKAVKDAGANEPIVKALTGMVAQIEKQKADLEGATTKTGEIETLLKGVNDQIVEIKSTIDKVKTRPGSLSGLAEEKQKFSMGNLVQFKMGRAEEKDVGFELEVMTEFAKQTGKGEYTQKSVISTLTGAGGGFPLPVEVYGSIVEKARATSQLSQLGVYEPSLEGLSALSVPQERTIFSPAATRELAALPLSANTYGNVNFSPKKFGMITGITDEMLRQGGAFVDAFVRRVAAIDMRNQKESLALAGRGQQFNEPEGLLGRTNYTTTTLTVALGTDGRRLDPTDLGDMEIAIAEANRLDGAEALGYYFNTSLLKGLKQKFATYGIKAGDLSTGADATNSMPVSPWYWMSIKNLETLMGYKARNSTLIPKDVVQGSTLNASYAMFGDWAKVWMPTWGPMEMIISNQATVDGISAFQNGLVYVGYKHWFDVNVVAPDALTLVKGFKTV